MCLRFFVDDRREKLRVASVLPEMIGRAPVPDALVVMGPCRGCNPCWVGKRSSAGSSLLSKGGSRRTAHVENTPGIGWARKKRGPGGVRGSNGG